MIKFIMVMIYILNGDIKTEQVPYKTLDDCKIAGVHRVVELQDDPRIDDILFGACITLRVQEVRK